MHAFKKMLVLSSVVVAWLSAVSAFAHHSYAMFDLDKSVKLEGTVKEFQWTNPHIWIQLMANDPATGELVEWSIEGDSPNVLTKRGWNRKLLHPGDKVEMTIHPLKNGIHGGSLESVSMNGQRIGGAFPKPAEEAKP